MLYNVFEGVVNSFVHIIMYSYYLLAAMGPQYQKFLWWKKYITNMQMVKIWMNWLVKNKSLKFSNSCEFQIQFCLAFIHSAQLVYTDCGYPRWSVFFTLPNAIFFYFLFNDFYRKSYKIKTNKNGSTSNENHVQNVQTNGVNHNNNNNNNTKKTDGDKKENWRQHTYIQREINYREPFYDN